MRVLVSYEALLQLDPTNVRDLHGALENFDRFRSQVEAADRWVAGRPRGR